MVKVYEGTGNGFRWWIDASKILHIENTDPDSGVTPTVTMNAFPQDMSDVGEYEGLDIGSNLNLSTSSPIFTIYNTQNVLITIGNNVVIQKQNAIRVSASTIRVDIGDNVYLYALYSLQLYPSNILVIHAGSDLYLTQYCICATPDYSSTVFAEYTFGDGVYFNGSSCLYSFRAMADSHLNQMIWVNGIAYVQKTTPLIFTDADRTSITIKELCTHSTLAENEVFGLRLFATVDYSSNEYDNHVREIRINRITGIERISLKDGYYSSIVLPEGVSRVSGNITLTNQYELTIPASVSSWGCTIHSDSRVSIINFLNPGTLEIPGTFQSSNWLDEIRFCAWELRIGQYAFANNTSLKKITFEKPWWENTSSAIRSDAFYNDTGSTIATEVVASSSGFMPVTTGRTWVYSLAHTLTIEYTGPEGFPAPPIYVALLSSGETFSVESPEITGYSPSTSIIQGTMGDEDLLYTVTYAERLVVLTFTDDVDIPGYYSGQQVRYGTEIQVSPKPKTGYAETLKLNGNVYAQSIYRLTADASFTVEYVAKTVTIFYYPGFGGRVGHGSGTWGTQITAPSPVELDSSLDYTIDTFQGWSTTSDGPVLFTYNDKYQLDAYLSDDSQTQINFYAVWNRPDRTVTVTYTGPEGFPAQQPRTFSGKAGTSYIITSPTVAGYTPSQSLISGALKNTDESFTVTYSLKTYSVSVNTHLTVTYVENGEVHQVTGTKSLPAGVVLTIEPKDIISEKRVSYGYQIQEGSTWSEEVAFTTAPATLTTGAYNLRINSVYAPIEYTVAFDSSNGTGVMSPMSCEYGTEYTLPANAFQRPGYEFKGWSVGAQDDVVEQAEGSKFRNLTVVDGETVTLYAVWGQVTYTLTVNHKYVDGRTGNITVDTRTGKYTYGQQYRIMKMDVAGYTSTDPIHEGTMPNRDMTVEYVYNRNKYTITVQFTCVVSGVELPANISEEWYYGERYDYTDRITPITGYIPNPPEVYGVASEDKTWAVRYEMDTYILRINYLLGETLLKRDAITLTNGEVYSIPAPITRIGYTPDPEPLTGVMGQSDIERNVRFIRNTQSMKLNLSVVTETEYTDEVILENIPWVLDQEVVRNGLTFRTIAVGTNCKLVYSGIPQTTGLEKFDLPGECAEYKILVEMTVYTAKYVRPVEFTYNVDIEDDFDGFLLPISSEGWGEERTIGTKNGMTVKVAGNILSQTRICLDGYPLTTGTTEFSIEGDYRVLNLKLVVSGTRRPAVLNFADTNESIRAPDSFPQGLTSEPPTDVTVRSHTFTIPDNRPVKKAYTFQYWCDTQSGNGKRYYPRNSVGPVGYGETMTLYAIWSHNVLRKNSDKVTIGAESDLVLNATLPTYYEGYRGIAHEGQLLPLESDEGYDSVSVRRMTVEGGKTFLGAEVQNTLQVTEDNTFKVYKTLDVGEYAVVTSAMIMYSGTWYDSMIYYGMSIIPNPDDFNKNLELPICNLMKYLPSDDPDATSGVLSGMLVLSDPSCPNVVIGALEKGYKVTLSQNPILTKPSKYTYLIDLGNVESYSVEITRVNPDFIEDIGTIEDVTPENPLHKFWSNAKWITEVKRFFDSWQNFNRNEYNQWSGGYTFSFTPSDENLFPTIRKNVFVSGNISFDYDFTVTLGLQFVVASMLGSKALSVAFTLDFRYKTASGQVKTLVANVYDGLPFTMPPFPADADPTAMMWSDASGRRFVPGQTLTSGAIMGYMGASSPQFQAEYRTVSRLFFMYANSDKDDYPPLDLSRVTFNVTNLSTEDQTILVKALGGGGGAGINSKHESTSNHDTEHKYRTRLGGGGGAGQSVLGSYTITENTPNIMIELGQRGSQGKNGGDTRVYARNLATDIAYAKGGIAGGNADNDYPAGGRGYGRTDSSGIPWGSGGNGYNNGKYRTDISALTYNERCVGGNGAPYEKIGEWGGTGGKGGWGCSGGGGADFDLTPYVPQYVPGATYQKYQCVKNGSTYYLCKGDNVSSSPGSDSNWVILPQVSSRGGTDDSPRWYTEPDHTLQYDQKNVEPLLGGGGGTSYVKGGDDKCQKGAGGAVAIIFYTKSVVS